MQRFVISEEEKEAILSFVAEECDTKGYASISDVPFGSTAEENYEGLMKPLYFCQRKYNMDLGVCSILLEMGTDANTLDEAMYSGYLTGKVLTEIIMAYEEK